MEMVASSHLEQVHHEVSNKKQSFIGNAGDFSSRIWQLLSTHAHGRWVADCLLLGQFLGKPMNRIMDFYPFNHTI